MKKVLLSLLFLTSLSLAADTTINDSKNAFQSLDCEFGECAQNPNDPAPKNEAKRQDASTATQDSYAPRDERRDKVVNSAYKRTDESPQSNYVPAQPRSYKSFYQYFGYGEFKGYVSEKYENAFYGDLYEAKDLNYDMQQITYGGFLPDANMKFELSLNFASHTDATNTATNLIGMNYDLMIGKASMGSFISTFPYVRIGLGVQSYDATQINTDIENTASFAFLREKDTLALGGIRLGVGYSLILFNFIEAYADATIMVTKGILKDFDFPDNDFQATFTYAMVGYGVNILF